MHKTVRNSKIIKVLLLLAALAFALAGCSSGGGGGGGSKGFGGGAVVIGSDLQNAHNFGTITTSIPPYDTSISVGGENDYYKFTIEGSADVIIYTTSSIDTYGYLMDGTGTTELDSDDDSGTGTNFQITRNLSAGTYYVRVRGYSDSTTGDYTLNIDLSNFVQEAPTTPTNVVATASGASQITVSWSASTDNVDVSGYRVYRDNLILATVTSGTSYVDTTVTAGVNYCYTVEAYDASGNVSGRSPQSCNSTSTTSPITASAVYTGSRHTVAMLPDGTLWAWGDNDYGQLGDGTTTDNSLPVQVTGLSGVTITDIAAGEYHTMMIDNAGDVWAWGDDISGQVGNGLPFNDTSTPSEVLTGMGVTTIAAGGYHSLAINSLGQLWAWGNDNYGQLGTGGFTNTAAPTMVSLPFNIVDIAAGEYHTVALDDLGNVWTWGSNDHGQLGNYSTSYTSSPQQVLTGVQAIAAGKYFTLALMNNGTVMAWGDGRYGQLGNGSLSTDSTYPVTVLNLSNIVEIQAGAYFGLAIDSLGYTYTWGSNYYGQIGDGTTNSYPTRYLATVFNGAAMVSAGGWHVMALWPDGSLWGLGNNEFGQIGDGGVYLQSLNLVQTQIQVHVTKIATGGWHSFALKSDGTAVGWGYNYYGALGDGTTTGTSTPVQVSSLTDISAISGGGWHTLAIDSAGSLWAWGLNGDGGRLGNGSLTESHTPVQVSTVNGLTSAVAVGAGRWHSVAIDTAGDVWAWGDNDYGQLGNGSNAETTIPQRINTLSNIQKIAVGGWHNLAVDASGNAWGWGINNTSQIGNGNTTNVLTPAIVLTGVVDVAASRHHSLAVKSDGTVWAWGLNDEGQLGNGTYSNSSLPIQVPGLYNVVSVYVGDYHSMALKNDGTLWGWGYNWEGEVGNGATADVMVPTQILSGVDSVSVGFFHNIAQKTDGTVWAWGINQDGQLGDGTTVDKLSPVQINP